MVSVIKLVKEHWALLLVVIAVIGFLVFMNTKKCACGKKNGICVCSMKGCGCSATEHFQVNRPIRPGSPKKPLGDKDIIFASGDSIAGAAAIDAGKIVYPDTAADIAYDLSYDTGADQDTQDNTYAPVYEAPSKTPSSRSDVVVTPKQVVAAIANSKMTNAELQPRQTTSGPVVGYSAGSTSVYDEAVNDDVVPDIAEGLDVMPADDGELDFFPVDDGYFA
ncbi:hypothetical protein ATCVMN08101_791R [Acanthocystis turfacea Chlorella virus MN0810.1]|nr:hypothetical protein ATCVMN08101_791R [Acanthocystis turfacea Chlorella virus MN0810.1]